MNDRVYRVFTEKRPEYDNESALILHNISTILRIKGISNLRVFHRYDIQGISESDYQSARFSVFAEPPLDYIYDEALPEDIIRPENGRIFGKEYLPGQYDQRADSAAQAIQILTRGEKPLIRYASVMFFYGGISSEEFENIKIFLINPVDSREAQLSKPSTLMEKREVPPDIPVLTGFINKGGSELEKFISVMGLAMDYNDLVFLQSYFKNEEKRDPTLTELRIIDTYWSDHCRHTTFLTQIDKVEFADGPYRQPLEKAYHSYLESRSFLKSGKNGKSAGISLMDLATTAMKELKARGLIPDLDESDEINACSIVVPVEHEGLTEDWLVMFKNETHNHPTEIEPFGGAATCIGGAIRDPLSGRSYVYQAMRVTGSGDPRENASYAMPGKLPQRKITVEAAHGFSSYGNQIGLATGLVSEIYHEGYKAKRMEVGALVGAVRRSAVTRKAPVKGDAVILLGGRTGRDGCGGATGSSKIHTEESIIKAGSEVQKGNAPEERKIQRLFRNPSVSVLIKKCNDFGAGGISVAIGEIADGLTIDLDAVPRKYEGLDGTELAISESQERMAVLVDRKDIKAFIEAASMENLEATVVAEVSEEKRIKMTWRGKLIVDISRDFLNTNGAKRHADVKVISPTGFRVTKSDNTGMEESWLESLTNLNSASQKGLAEMFDSYIG
ncbi:MAG: AIR synthase-related protein, partial [Brevinematales bacterium]